MWVDRNGLLHSKTSEPTDEDETTSIMAPKNITVSTVNIGRYSSLAAGSTVEIATTISGVAVGDLVILEHPALSEAPAPSADIVYTTPRVTTDTITVLFRNYTSSAVTAGDGRTYRYFWFDLT